MVMGGGQWYIILVEGYSPNPPHPTFPGGGNKSTWRKPTTFDRALTKSFPTHKCHEHEVRLKPITSGMKGTRYNLNYIEKMPQSNFNAY